MDEHYPKQWIWNIATVVLTMQNSSPSSQDLILEVRLWQLKPQKIASLDWFWFCEVLLWLGLEFMSFGRVPTGRAMIPIKGRRGCSGQDLWSNTPGSPSKFFYLILISTNKCCPPRPIPLPKDCPCNLQGHLYVHLTLMFKIQNMVTFL